MPLGASAIGPGDVKHSNPIQGVHEPSLVSLGFEVMVARAN